MILLFFFVVLDVIISDLIPSSSKYLLSSSKCWFARIVVGAIIAAWYPFLTAIYIEIAATIVFPLPTSPCINLFITLSLNISFSISSTTLFCAFVKENGNNFKNFDISTFLNLFVFFTKSELSFTDISASSSKNNSSNISRLRASFTALNVFGKWTFSVA